MIEHKYANGYYGRDKRMPELPDVETFRRYLHATALHQKVAEVRVRNRRVLAGVSPSRLKETLQGACFDQTDRCGKYLFVQTDSGPVLVLHFGMTGHLEYEKDRTPGKHDRLLFDFDNGYSLAYVCQRLLGKVSVVDSVEQFTHDNHLGPDALAIGADEFTRRLQKSRATVKSWLMNQKLIAGIGNIYSDEILFQSHLAPNRKAGAFGKKETERLYRQMRRVLETAIERKADPSRMPSSWLLPHRQEDNTCPRCHGQVSKTKVAGRTTYWCPKCQQT